MYKVTDFCKKCNVRIRCGVMLDENEFVMRPNDTFEVQFPCSSCKAMLRCRVKEMEWNKGKPINVNRNPLL